MTLLIWRLRVSVQSTCLRLFLNFSWQKLLKFLIRVFLRLILILARVKVIRNFAEWSEISVVTLQDTLFSLMLLWKMSVSVLDLRVWQVGIFINGKKLLEQIYRSRNWEVRLWDCCWNLPSDMCLCFAFNFFLKLASGYCWTLVLTFLGFVYASNYAVFCWWFQKYWFWFYCFINFWIFPKRIIYIRRYYTGGSLLFQIQLEFLLVVEVNVY